MQRTLTRYGIADIEAMFASKRSDIAFLNILKHELQYRNVPRATALLKEVDAILANTNHLSGTTSSMTGSVTANSRNLNQQGELQIPATTIPGASQVPKPLKVADSSSEISQASQVTANRINVEMAYRILKATPSSTWESIEQTRRQLVQRSHPSRVASMNEENRAKILEESRGVNDAYAVLSTLR
jgi:hypothetical protein